MGRTGMMLMSFVAIQSLDRMWRGGIYYDTKGFTPILEAMQMVQAQYHPKAGEFDEVEGNFYALMNACMALVPGYFSHVEQSQFRNADFSWLVRQFSPAVNQFQR